MFDLLGTLIPNPGDIFKGFVEGKIEKEAFACLMSASISGGLTFAFETGRRKLWGEGRALQRSCGAVYVACQPLVESGYIRSLAVHKDMLDPDFLSQFQAEYKARTK